jgi:hypothetical protein
MGMSDHPTFDAAAKPVDPEDSSITPAADSSNWVRTVKREEFWLKNPELANVLDSSQKTNERWESWCDFMAPIVVGQAVSEATGPSTKG